MNKKILFGLNRSDFRSPAHFAADVGRLEESGWDFAFIPCSPLLIKDPYLMMAEALRQTKSINMGTLIENPVMRDPAVIAGSIATLDAVDPGRIHLGIGVGDTAVRLMGKRPAKVQELQTATAAIKTLLDGETLDVRAAQPARLRHSIEPSRKPPIWIASQGPKTLRMAGQIADGVFIRVGTHTKNIQHAIEQVHLGARDAGRRPSDIKIACIFHTILEDDAAREKSIARSTAAGYFEHTPSLFDHAGLKWNGPAIDKLKDQVWPDFHHVSDLEAAGELVSFLSDEVADAFSLHGDTIEIGAQLRSIIDQCHPIDLIIPHPMPTPRPGIALTHYSDVFADKIMSNLL